MKVLFYGGHYHEQEQIIKKAIKNGYREFYPPKKEKNEKEEKIIYETV